ncbi:hypothetical protein T11_12145 [Trichinella zimbabwensis]|uniref:Uncharacterized protein n=1 Tax=Trichinella zimbabwensis TaxID=268475 RepID=A0A0V1GFF8_9BILA|nr:hypothetical protein T11_12145 [Trichinella zimbabwensis]
MLLESATIACGLHYQDGRFYIALNCSHYNRIMIKVYATISTNELSCKVRPGSL